MWKRLLTLPTWASLVLLGLVIVAVALFFSSLNPLNPLNFLGKPTAEVDVSRPAVIRQIKGLQRLETSSYSIDKIIQAGTDGNVFQDLLYGDHLLLVAHGQVIAGVDLQKLSDDAVRVSGSSLAITIPSSEIFTTTLDTDQTKVFDRDMGLLSKGDKDLESQARAAAVSQIEQAACQDGILQRAADQAKARITQMYTMVGFDNVEVQAPAGTC